MPPARRKVIVFLGLVAFGAGVAGWLQYSGDPPSRRPPRERGRAVRVLELQPLEAIPRAVGYGVVEAQRTWQAVAEVGGTLVEVSDDLEVGRVVPEGTRLFKINPGTYQLEKSRTEATVRGVKAQIDEIKAREESARSSLSLDKKVLDLARKDLERARKAQADGLASITEVDAAERGVLTAEKSVQSLENTLLELPASRRVLEAQIAQQQVGVEGARLHLAKTEVVAPFTMRIRQVSAGLHQAVGAGQVVAIGDGIDVMELAAQLPIGAIGPLMAPRRASPADADAGAPPDDTDAGAGAPPDDTDAGVGAPPADAGATPGGSRASSISAVIRLKSQGVEATWKGKFRRFQGVDPATRTMGVVVEVADPRRREGRSGPPLSAGLHVEVELSGAPRPGCLAIPRTALHRDKVYVVGAGDRLEVRSVSADLIQEQYACIASGVAAGERVVLTALAPAVEGMLLAPRKDDAAASWLSAAVKGEAPSP